MASKRVAKPPRYGCHTSVSHGYLTGVEYALSVGARSIQMFLGSKFSYTSKIIPASVYEPVAKLVQDTGMFFIAHSPYSLNFAHPLHETETGRKALQRYINDLINITNLGGVGSVLHMGSNVKKLNQPMTGAYKNFVDNLRWVVERAPANAVIILENMAGGGTQMCTTLDELADFWNNYVDRDLKKRVRWCIDTAHLYAAGEFDLSKRTEAVRFYKEFEAKIGWRYILCFHFNGSKSALGSHHDNHADIGPEHCGLIETKGLRQIAKIAGATDKPLILEIPGDERHPFEQLQLIESWFN